MKCPKCKKEMKMVVNLYYCKKCDNHYTKNKELVIIGPYYYGKPATKGVK